MRKVALFLAIVLVLSMPLTVMAAPRAMSILPVLEIDGSSATCRTTVIGNNTSEFIQVTMTLKQGSTTLRSWYGEGYGYVYMLKETLVLKGHTYNLVVAVTVNGVASTPVTVSETN